jgi:alanyl-tRNA synthetase
MTSAVMSSADIREAFLSFFEEKGHTRVASSPLVPGNDPTLLFTNAGMVQFKDVFLGTDKRSYTRAVTSQRCVRAGGKHNDLENVGYTARHHTFFEMLGNFSFGDYFKRDAILYAWEFLTSDKWLAIPAAKLTATVYIDDDEAFAIWRDEVGLPEERIIRIGDKGDEKYNSDNFWSMGDTGPCGPCSEIFYDHGADIWGGPPGSPEEDGDRFIEIWNNVFMQFNRSADGVMAPLPAPSVDTGMGLERIAAVLQHVHSNYEIDLFQYLLAAAQKVTGANDANDKSLRVIADHIRSCSFLIIDGVLPGNEGRGYVLRRIMRRAIRHGNKLGAKGSFFFKLVASLADVMGDAYPELRQQQSAIEKVIKTEEEQFAKTLDKGMAILNEALEGLQGDTIPGDVVFRLYDTFGFPTDLTNDIARERDLKIDLEGYEHAMAAQRKRSQESGAFSMDYNDNLEIPGETNFTGYTDITGSGKVTFLLADGNAVSSLSEGEKGVLVLDQTPFYAESGGQVGDTGYLLGDSCKLEVRNTTKHQGNHLHHVYVSQGKISIGETLNSEIDNGLRARIRRNHSATHLLQAALRYVVGDHVAQKGSLNDADKLRFDFSHYEAVTPEQLSQIEAQVNQQILNNTAVETVITDMDDARERGAMALFGEKYGDVVRVLSMGDGYSVELCGGTHVSRTGDIGLFRITSEAGISSGVRRIEAVTGLGALALFDKMKSTVGDICLEIKANSENVVDKVSALRLENRELEKEISRLKAKLASGAGSDILSSAVDVAGVKLLAINLEDADPKTLRDTADQVKNKMGSGVVVLATASDGKVAIVTGVTKDLTDRVKAGELMAFLASQVGGKGGGRPDMAQGGGTDISALPAALTSVSDWVAQKLS